MAKYVSKTLVCSFPHVFELYSAIPGATPKASVTVLIDKNDTQTINEINAKYDEAIKEGLNKKFGGKMPNKASLRPVLKDGDEKDRPEFQGKWLLNCQSTSLPQVVDADLNDITDPKAIVGGDFIRVSVNFSAYNVGGSKGVSCYLQGVQLVEKTKTPFGGKSDAHSDFAVKNNRDFL